MIKKIFRKSMIVGIIGFILLASFPLVITVVPKVKIYEGKQLSREKNRQGLSMIFITYDFGI